MGKAEDDRVVAAGVGPESSDQNAQTRWCGGGGCRNCGLCWCFGGVRRLTGLQCLLVLLLSAAVFLSAIFWLPPFLQFADRGDPDLDSRFKDHDIVASFSLKKPLSLVEDNILQLEEDILNEISFDTTKVVIISLEPIAGSNKTKVVFGIDPDANYSRISQTTQSFIRDNFVSLVTEQTSLRLTTSLFGEPFLFEVLKFPGGITIIPVESAFPLQKVQIYFNFTLNFSIHQIQLNFGELTSQLKLGLHLASFENLYVSLSNSKGSTVDAPTIVQSSVLLAVGNTPSTQRLKQLAQTITHSHSQNLGLNNTVFGRVKQVRLSTVLQHSLSGDGSGTSPSPAPQPHAHDHHHHHHQHLHHHHHHHHHHDTHLSPVTAPAPAPAIEGGVPAPQDASPGPKRSMPAPEKSYEAKPPGCRHEYKRSSKRNARKQSHSAPTVAPYISPNYPPAFQPVPSAPISHTIPASSPLPNVVFAHAQPPSNSESNSDHSYTLQSVAPSPASSSAGFLNAAPWASSLFLALILHL